MIVMENVKESISRVADLRPSLVERLASESQFRKDTIDQQAIPTVKEDHILDPWFYKCDDKIVKYDMQELGKWKASVVQRCCPAYGSREVTY